MFLRNLEHRLQYRDDEQTQTLPGGAGEREALAHAMGYRGTAAFDGAISRCIAPTSRSSSSRCSASRAPRRAAGRSGDGRGGAAPTFAAIWREDVGAESA